LNAAGGGDAFLKAAFDPGRSLETAKMSIRAARAGKTGLYQRRRFDITFLA